MIYTPMTNLAMRIAYEAHHGQMDRCGIPYIFHPIHLAEQMDDEISCTVALLHDVVEDTAVTMEILAKQFPCEVIDALTLLTHDPKVDYFNYVRTIRSNPIAKNTKKNSTILNPALLKNPPMPPPDFLLETGKAAQNRRLLHFRPKAASPSFED